MPTWVTTVISLVSGLIPLVSQIGKRWEESAGFGAIADLLLKSPVLADLEKAGAALFPAAEKKIQAVLAALHLGYTPATKWIQTALNAIAHTGFINFGPQLLVDGLFGPKTIIAVTTLQNKLGLTPTGAVAELEYKAINELLTKHHL